jgi:hypothetical protein
MNNYKNKKEIIHQDNISSITKEDALFGQEIK